MRRRPFVRYVGDWSIFLQRAYREAGLGSESGFLWRSTCGEKPILGLSMLIFGAGKNLDVAWHFAP
jgi:hypothetical protein